MLCTYKLHRKTGFHFEKQICQIWKSQKQCFPCNLNEALCCRQVFLRCSPRKHLQAFSLDSHKLIMLTKPFTIPCSFFDLLFVGLHILSCCSLVKIPDGKYDSIFKTVFCSNCHNVFNCISLCFTASQRCSIFSPMQ